VNQSALLEDLRALGVELTVEGDQLRCRGPRGWQNPNLLGDLREHKRALIRRILLDGDQQADPPKAVDRIDFSAELQTAVLIRSHLFGGREVWIALSDEAAAEILSEEQRRADPRPVLRQADVQRLAGKSPELIAAVLRVAAVFPGSRVIQ